MLRTQICNDSSFTVRLPKRRHRNKIIELAQTFLAYEQSLPPEEQSPYLETINTLLAEVVADRHTVSDGEGRRHSASKAVQRLDRKAKRVIDHIAQVVRTAVYETPEEAHHWGFQVRPATGSFRKPVTRAKRLALLDAYLAKEESRPEAERFTTPDLSKVQQLRDQLAASLAARHTALTQRESAVAARNAASYALIEHLNVALVYLVANRFDFKLSPDLQHWGFAVVAKRGTSHPTEVQAEEAAITTEATAQDDVAASNGDVYEAEQNGTYQPEPSMSNGSA